MPGFKPTCSSHAMRFGSGEGTIYLSQPCLSSGPWGKESRRAVRVSLSHSLLTVRLGKEKPLDHVAAVQGLGHMV